MLLSGASYRKTRPVKMYNAIMLGAYLLLEVVYTFFIVFCIRLMLKDFLEERAKKKAKRQEQDEYAKLVEAIKQGRDVPIDFDGAPGTVYTSGPTK
jgi:hypothetical protein